MTRVVEGLRSTINPLADFRVYLCLLRLVKEEQPDLIHCHSAKAGMLGRIVASQLKIPCVYTVHGWGFGKGRKHINSFILKVIEHLLKGLTTHFIAVSDSDRQVGINNLAISPEKITTIRNGISYSISNSHLRTVDAKVIMVARNDFPKDYKTLAFALAKSTIPSAIFVGNGTDSTDFIDEMNAIVRGNCEIDFLGLRNDIAHLLESASIFVLSSHYEALPLSIIEAMSKGLPIIASDVGGVNELVSDGINGYLFPAGDFEMLSVRLNALAQDVELRRRMGEESIRRYKYEFSSVRMMNQTYLIYQKVLGIKITSNLL